MSEPRARIGLINPVVDTGAIDVDATLAPFRANGLDIEAAFLSQGPTSIETDADVAACLPDLLQTSARLVICGVDAIVINCMCDPGVNELRAIHELPVLGTAQTSMHVAAALGRRFSLLDVVAGGRAIVERQVRDFGVERSYVSHHSIDVPVLEIYRDVPRTARALENEALAAIAKGADTLLLGCTGLAELADELARRLDAQGSRASVIEPLRTTLALARAILETRAFR